MPDTLTLLQFEHRNLTSLLGLLLQQVRHMTRGDPVNYSALSSAFTYLSGYPDQCHHPKEDLVYRKLLNRDPGMASSLRDLVAEHETLSHRTRDLSRAVDELRRNPAASGKLAKQLDEFVDSYRHHMSMEEQHFFPAARKLLSRDDWDDIDFSVFDSTDPLFDQEAESRFAELRNEIRRMGAAEDTATRQREETARLAALKSVAAFNDAMQGDGERLHLAPSPQGGYQLERDGSVLVSIPECSESRAAWCAYFFWKGIAQRTGL